MGPLLGSGCPRGGNPVWVGVISWWGSSRGEGLGSREARAAPDLAPQGWGGDSQALVCPCCGERVGGRVP